MGLFWMDYERERRRRVRWPLVATIGAAIALSIVGKLCWDRFAEPARSRIALAHHLRTSAEQTWAGLSYPTTQQVTPGGRTAQDRAGELLLALLSGNSLHGSMLYFGKSKVGERYVYVSVVQTDTSPVGSLTLVVRVFSAPTLFTSQEQIGNVELFPLITFVNAYTVEPVRSADASHDLYELRGTRDGSPFCFQLSIDSASRPTLAEMPAE